MNSLKLQNQYDIHKMTHNSQILTHMYHNFKKAFHLIYSCGLVHIICNHVQLQHDHFFKYDDKQKTTQDIRITFGAEHVTPVEHNKSYDKFGK